MLIFLICVCFQIGQYSHQVLIKCFYFLLKIFDVDSFVLLSYFLERFCHLGEILVDSLDLAIIKLLMVADKNLGIVDSLLKSRQDNFTIFKLKKLFKLVYVVGVMRKMQSFFLLAEIAYFPILFAGLYGAYKSYRLFMFGTKLLAHLNIICL